MVEIKRIDAERDKFYISVRKEVNSSNVFTIIEDKESAQKVLENGNNALLLDTTDSYGVSVLDKIIKLHEDIAVALLKESNSENKKFELFLNITSRCGRPILFDALEHHKFADEMLNCLNSGTHIDALTEIKDVYGSTGLHILAKHEDLAKKMLSSSKNVELMAETVNKNGWSALHESAYLHKSIADHIVGLSSAENGIFESRRTGNGFSILDIARSTQKRNNLLRK